MSEAKNNCPNCSCNHCVTVTMDEVFEAQYSGKHVEIPIGDTAQLLVMPWWPKLSANQPVSIEALQVFDSFPSTVGIKISFTKIWYFPAVKRWIERHADDVAYAVSYESKVLAKSLQATIPRETMVDRLKLSPRAIEERVYRDKLVAFGPLIDPRTKETF